MARKTFFSFHYNADCWRAWNVRNSWVVKGENVSTGFFDNSVFEASQKTSPDALKRFLRDGLVNTSVTCVLTGENTWSRRWVRYEIARSVVKGNGILTVDIHGVRNRKGMTSSQGPDPLDAMGVYRTDDGIFLAEWDRGRWVKYGDYRRAIPSDKLWFAAPSSTAVVQLSTHCFRYDFIANNGRANLGKWIERAAARAGR